MHIAYIGNFEAPHSTENHVARAFENNGHTVARLQENRWAEWNRTPMEPPAFLTWTRTGWDWPHYGMSNMEAKNAQLQMLVQMHRTSTPVIGMHLDIWWGLERQSQILDEPFFASDILFTADGGHDDLWSKVGVNHVWMPPGVSLAECEPGTPRDDLRSPLAFVGSWQGHYHEESKHRHELVNWLRDNFRRDCAFWPKPGEPAVRGAALRDLYASVAVLVGDSCFAGSDLASYWSDRIPETLGRGGYLLHPFVEGMVEQGFDDSTMGVWPAFDWPALGDRIEWALANPTERQAIAQAGREVVLARHTYEVRVNEVLEVLYERKLLKRPKKASTK